MRERPRTRLIDKASADEFVGPPEPGFFDKVKGFFNFPKPNFSAETITRDINERFENAAILKPPIKRAGAKIVSVASSTVKQSVVVLVAAAFVFAFVYFFAGNLATKATR